MICQLNDGPCKTYLFVSQKTKEAMLVDPLLERVEEDLALLRHEGLRLVYVMDTHTHADHLSAGAALSERAGVPYLMHAASRSRHVSRRLEDGDSLGLGELTVDFLHTPGHTKDSLTVRVGDALLSGDFLFIGPDGAGRLDLPGSDPAAHFESLKKIDGLPDATRLLPAHDYRGASESTLGAERGSNPVLSPRTRDQYVSWWLGKKLGPADWMGAVVAENIKGARDPRAVSIPAGAAACACATAPEPHPDLPRLAPSDLAAMLRDSARKVVLLDVRTPEEFDSDGRIAGAILIPIDELAGRLSEVPPGPVAVICRSGKRAARGAALLRSSGRSETWVLTGGMLAWREARLPTA